jgi:hypothetical protein
MVDSLEGVWRELIASSLAMVANSHLLIIGPLKLNIANTSMFFHG